MRVLLVDLETAWRGGQNQALLLLEGLRGRGHKVALVAANRSALGQRAAASGLRVHFVSRGIFRFPAAFRVRELLRKCPFDVVHANEAQAVTAVWLALRLPRAPLPVPFVISRRVGYPLGKSALAQARYRSASRIVANSRWVAGQASASCAPADKLDVVYEGAEIPPQFSEEERQRARAFWGISPSTPLLGCVGVLLPDKGQEWLIRALAEIQGEFPAAKLILAGDGPCRARLESLARDLVLNDNVIFAGFVENVETVYAALDIFLLPSLFEALNNSLLAAMAYEIPSIAFNRGALGEIIEHGKSGLLVSGPNVEEISQAAARLLRAPQFARQVGRSGRLRVEQHFSAQRMVEGMIHVYQQVLENK